MITLVIEGESGSGLTYQLDRQSISVGASSRNDIVLRTPGVAPHHLVVQQHDGVVTFLSQPRQIVVLNGERRSRGVLKVGDKIRIGASTIIFQGDEVDSTDARIADESSVEQQVDADHTETSAPARGRSEVALYREPDRLTGARRQLIEVFRSRVRSDIVPALRGWMAGVFTDRRAMLATIDGDGRLQPLVSQWQGDVPRLPPRIFEELGERGRYAVLRLAGREHLVYPIDRGVGAPDAYLLVETADGELEQDRELVGELSRLLSVHWDRIEQSTVLYGEWATHARRELETQLPGTSQAVRLLRDAVGAAARTSAPVMMCGPVGSGRMFLASLIASLHPAGELPITAFQARADGDSSLRVELFGAAPDDSVVNLGDRYRGSVVVVREVHLMTPALQRELAAAIAADTESGLGPGVRWIVTVAGDATNLLNKGALDVALFRLFEGHVIRIPPLENRREDLPLVMVRLLERVGAEQGKKIRGIELETLNSVLDHPFDGQMTELLAEVRRLVSATPDGEMVRGIVPRRAGGDTGAPADDTADVLGDIVGSDNLKDVIPNVERLIIDRVLRRVGGNQSKAARIMHLSRGALISKIKEYEIPDYRGRRRAE